MDGASLEEDHPDIYNNGPTEEMERLWDKEWGGRRLPWTGIWPGVAECREFGWFCTFSRETGYVPCEPDAEGATEDLNRLYVEALWDRKAQRWVKQ